MKEASFVPEPYSKPLESKVSSWESPSNIALIKYWGKYGLQLPRNSSLSFTLSECRTRTTLHFEPSEGEAPEVQVFLDGAHMASFEPKVVQFLDRIKQYVPLVRSGHFRIETSNTFPHSSGIASSASGMSALALCLMSLEQQFLETPYPEKDFKRKASFLARLGSGSACRSIEGPLVVWGEHPGVPGSSDLYGVILQQKVHPRFHGYRDTILLVDKGEKQVSSSVGHKLMYGHPFAENRFKQANENLSKLLGVLESGDLQEFVKTVETEALSLHAMMLSSSPGYILMKPQTLQIIEAIRTYRADTGIPVCFTLDAGANVHVLYPDQEKEKVLDFIKSHLVGYCENEQYICDSIGNGAKKM